MQSTLPVSAQSPQAASHGLFGTIVHWVITLLGIVLLGLLLSIALEWLGMYLKWWSLPGAQHSAYLLETELEHLDQVFTATALTDPLSLAHLWARLFYHYSGIEWLIAQLQQPPQAYQWIGWGHLHQGLLHLRDYVIAAANITQLCGARFAVALLSIPVFGLFLMIGLIDGLVQRDLRRFGGGRESSFAYHHLKKWLVPLVGFPVVIYLISPWPLHPTGVFIPPALLSGGLVSMIAYRFKKYL